MWSQHLAVVNDEIPMRIGILSGSADHDTVPIDFTPPQKEPTRKPSRKAVSDVDRKYICEEGDLQCLTIRPSLVQKKDHNNYSVVTVLSDFHVHHNSRRSKQHISSLLRE